MLSLSSPAKVNLFLEVVDKRPDGYHDIESILLAIDLFDTLTAEPAEDGLALLDCRPPGPPPGEANLVVRAARLLARECGVNRGIRFILEKRIPMGAGLGGGSSNAAAALRLANRLWKTGLTDAELEGLGARLGSDAPFFFHGGVCLCRGRGEEITPLGSFPAGISLGLILTRIHSDTAAAYRRLRLPAPTRRRPVKVFIEALESGDPEKVAAAAFNRFEDTVFAAFPELGEIQRRFSSLLTFAPRLSGSGGGLWFAGDAAAAAKAAARDARLGGLAARHDLRLLNIGQFHTIIPECEGL